MAERVAFLLAAATRNTSQTAFQSVYYQGFHFKTSAPDGPGNYLLTSRGRWLRYHGDRRGSPGPQRDKLSNSQLFGRILTGENNHVPV